jgi:hypothetical protein
MNERVKALNREQIQKKKAHGIAKNVQPGFMGDRGNFGTTKTRNRKASYSLSTWGTTC